MQVHSRECKVQNLRLRHPLLWSMRALPRKITLRRSFSHKNFHSKTVLSSVLASQSFSKHSRKVTVFYCVCPFFAVVRSCNRKVAVCPIAENLRNARGQASLGLPFLCIFVTWCDSWLLATALVRQNFWCCRFVAVCP